MLRMSVDRRDQYTPVSVMSAQMCAPLSDVKSSSKRKLGASETAMPSLPLEARLRTTVKSLSL